MNPKDIARIITENPDISHKYRHFYRSDGGHVTLDNKAQSEVQSAIHEIRRGLYAGRYFAFGDPFNAGRYYTNEGHYAFVVEADIDLNDLITDGEVDILILPNLGIGGSGDESDLKRVIDILQDNDVPQSLVDRYINIFGQKSGKQKNKEAIDLLKQITPYILRLGDQCRLEDRPLRPGEIRGIHLFLIGTDNHIVVKTLLNNGSELKEGDRIDKL